MSIVEYTYVKVTCDRSAAHWVADMAPNGKLAEHFAEHHNFRIDADGDVCGSCVYDDAHPEFVAMKRRAAAERAQRERDERRGAL